MHGRRRAGPVGTYRETYRDTDREHRSASTSGTKDRPSSSPNRSLRQRTSQTNPPVSSAFQTSGVPIPLWKGRQQRPGAGFDVQQSCRCTDVRTPGLRLPRNPLVDGEACSPRPRWRSSFGDHSARPTRSRRQQTSRRLYRSLAAGRTRHGRLQTA